MEKFLNIPVTSEGNQLVPVAALQTSWTNPSFLAIPVYPVSDITIA